jgi:hypothetical protein
MKVILDESLTEETPRMYGRTRNRDFADLGERLGRHIEPLPKRLLLQPSVSDGASPRSSFIDTLSIAYSAHQSVSFGPHDLWYIILTEVSRLVGENPEQYRGIYTKEKEGKIEILVPSGNEAVLPISTLIDSLKSHVPANVEAFLPEFSTHTPESRAVCMAAFADAAKHFYSYSVFCCGIRALEIRGTVEDWTKFVESTIAMRAVLDLHGKPGTVYNDDTRHWLLRVQQRAMQILASVEGGSTDFYKDIFTQKNIGSGGELAIDGWITEFFRKEKPGNKIENYPNTWSLVPHKGAASKRQYMNVYGQFFATKNAEGFIVPGYSSFTFEME